MNDTNGATGTNETQKPPAGRTAIIVLGMHRSGTSALTRMLSLLGAHLPEHVLGANPTNKAGHWEPERLVNLHDQMLGEAGSCWYDWRAFDPGALPPGRLDHYRAEIARIISEEYGDAPLIVLKDPRICRFVPLYETILADMGIAPRYVLVQRNPLGVIASLNTRDGMTPAYAGLLWLRHVLDGEAETRGSKRVFLSYEDFLDDWRHAAIRISQSLDLDWTRSPDDAAEAIEDHLTRDLQHHAPTLEDLDCDPNVTDWIKEAYHARLKLAVAENAPDALAKLSHIRNEFDRAAPLFGAAAIPELIARELRLAEARQQMVRGEETRKSDFEQLARLLAEARNGMGLDDGGMGTAKGKENSKSSVTPAPEVGNGGRIEALAREFSLTREWFTSQIAEGKRQTEKARKQAEQARAEAKAEAECAKADAESRAKELEQQLVDARVNLTAAQNQLAEKTAEIMSIQEDRKAIAQTLDQARIDQAHLNEVIRAIYASSSWKLTSPIRFARKSTNQLRAAASLTYGLARDRRLTPAVLKRGVERLPSLLRQGKLSSPASLPALVESHTPEEVSRVLEAFDSEFYLRTNADIAENGIDPFEHFMTHGWREHRDPSPDFSISYYLRRYPDIERGGINPFLHYVLHGKREKRAPLPHRKRIARLDFKPKVSAVVPNYNHARFLEQRLDSILQQTYQNVDVLVLDDCSSDDSREVIQAYCDRYPGRVRAMFNDVNSGNVFRQWRKGVENCDGDLVWICESDDFCEPDFLENLVDTFRDRSVQLAFGQIQFADKNGIFQAGLDEYREGAEPGIWNAPCIRPAHQWFANAFGVNNVIANVGGCVWRRQTLSENVWKEAETFSVVGDWFLYCHLAGGGQIAYEPSSVAYFRQHGNNTSVSSFEKTPYYVEHHRLMTLLRETWGVPDETVEKFFSKVDFQYRHFKMEKKIGPLSQFLDKEKLLSIKQKKMHILMAFLGFHPGGGEVFPINLANSLQLQGHLVSMLALDMSYVNDEMLSSLAPSIPVYDSAWVTEVGADRFLSEAAISIVHSHMVSLEIFFFEQCQIETEIPYLVSLHGSYEAAQIDQRMLQKISERVSHWVYTADRNLEPFRTLSIPASRFTKLANGMPDDPRPFPRTREELGIGENAVVFTLVARGIVRKGWRASIEAFITLREQHPHTEMHLLLCGDGEQAKKYEGIYGSRSDINFLGYQSRITGLYRMSDVALVPSRFEGESFPLCIIQSLQAGTPVIGSEIGEIPSMIAPKNACPAGILIKPVRDTELFTRNLVKAMTDMLSPSIRHQYAESANLLGDSYEIKTISDQYYKKYVDIMNV